MSTSRLMPFQPQSMTTAQLSEAMSDEAAWLAGLEPLGVAVKVG
jgi:hypothetical protein